MLICQILGPPQMNSDSASQSFFFGQYNFSIGGSFNFCENKQKKEKQ